METNLCNHRVYIRITNVCNKACNFCFVKNDPKASTFISVDQVKQIVEFELSRHNPSAPLRVQLSGGEPSLHPELKTIIAEILQYDGVRLLLETNASNLNNSDYLDIIKAFPRKLTLKISLNSELITSNSEWEENVNYFLGQNLPVLYYFGGRYKDEADKKYLEQIISKNNLQHVGLYPVMDCDFFADRPHKVLSCIIYDVDGSVLADLRSIK